MVLWGLLVKLTATVSGEERRVMFSRKKIMSGLLFATLAVAQSTWAGTVSEVLSAGGKGLEVLFAKIGLHEGAAQATESLKIAVGALTKGNVTEVTLREAFKSDPALAKLLSKDVDKLTSAEFATLVTRTARMADGQMGAAGRIACSACVSPELSKLGIQVVARGSGDVSATAVRESGVVLKGVALQQEIVKRATSLRVAGLGRAELSNMSETELKEILSFFSKAQGSNPAERKLGSAILAFHSSIVNDGAQVNLLDSKLYRMLGSSDEALSSGSMDEMSTLLNKIANDKTIRPEKRGEALREYFQSVGKGDS